MRVSGRSRYSIQKQSFYRKPGPLASLFLFVTLLAGQILFPCLASESEESLDQQRAFYEQAKSALAKGEKLRFQSLKKRLVGYPLYPYLEYADLAVGLSLRSEQKVDDFLQTYANTPPADRLRIRWLNLLKRHDRWQMFLKYYQPSINSTDLSCYQTHALYRSGETQAALKAALELWLVDKSQPKSCDPLFEILINKGLITEQVAWQRYSMAILSHEYALARYLERFFTSNYYKTLARNYVSVDRNYKRVGEYNLFDSLDSNEYGQEKNSPEVLQVIEHGITHLARRNAQQALTHWNRYLQTHKFDVAAQSRILYRLVIELHDQGHSEAADIYLKGRIELADLDLLEWRLRAAIREADWQALDHWLAILPKEVKEDEQWRYWQVRVKELLGEAVTNEAITSTADADDVYRELAKSRSYYGFISSQRLNTAYQMQHYPVTVAEDQVKELAGKAAFRRVYELRWHGEDLAARREWYNATQDFTEEQWLVAAHLAQHWQWHHQAIMSMVRASYWNDIELRFPQAYADIFQAEAQQQKIPFYLLMAISRQESALSPTAHSPAGARGLLQLMPTTARQVAKKYNLPYRNTEQLYQPETNIKLGSHYYRDMLDRFDNNRILATAAYNAGPHRVTRWLTQTGGKLPFDAWVEAIPFRETRNYVKNVLAFSVIYAHKLGVEPEMLSKKERGRLL